MRYSEIRTPISESLSDSDITDMIWTIILSLSSSDVPKIPVETINTELQHKCNMNLGTDELKSILDSIPSVQVVDDNYITLTPENGSIEDSADEVASMAKAPAKRTF